METTTFLAGTLGLFFLISGIGILLNVYTIQDAVHECSKSAVLRIFGGMLLLFLGLAVAIGHNVWESSWRTLITVIGWVTVCKGGVMILLPASYKKFIDAFNNTSTFVLGGVVWIILGLILLYYGIIF